MSIAADTLFHFTKNIETLSLIISDKFKPSYCLEYFPGEEKNLPHCARAFPMVCFCDIRLSQLTDHTNQYGKFGIGLEKSWGIKNGLSPVHYIHTNSPTYHGINKIFEFVRTNNAIDTLKDINKSIIDLKKYLKPYSGPVWDKTELSFIGHNTFYNEREWRYVFSLPNNIILTMSYNNFITQKVNIIERLVFDVSDVKYIFIEDESCIGDLKQRLINLNVSPKQIDIYLSKIITVKNIENDF